MQLSFGTAYHALFGRGHLVAGESVLVNSASGLVASAAAQLARRAGAFVIGTSSSIERLEKIPPDAAIDYTTEDVLERVRSLTDGRGVDVVFEHVGGKHFEAALASLAHDGRLVTVGAHAGEVVPPTSCRSSARNRQSSARAGAPTRSSQRCCGWPRPERSTKRSPLCFR